MAQQKCMEPLLVYLFCKRESFFDGILAFMEHGHPHVLSLLWSPLSLSNLNGFLALREVGGWRSLAWRRGIGDIHHLHIPKFWRGEERRGALEFSWGFGATLVEELFLFGVFGVWQLEEHSHGHFGEGAPFLHHWLPCNLLLKTESSTSLSGPLFIHRPHWLVGLATGLPFLVYSIQTPGAFHGPPVGRWASPGCPPIPF
eukprot:Gb_15485 [translate_table: standard]